MLGALRARDAVDVGASEYERYLASRRFRAIARRYAKRHELACGRCAERQGALFVAHRDPPPRHPGRERDRELEVLCERCAPQAAAAAGVRELPLIRAAPEAPSMPARRTRRHGRMVTRKRPHPARGVKLASWERDRVRRLAQERGIDPSNATAGALAPLVAEVLREREQDPW